MRLELWWLGVRGLCLEREGEEAVALPVAFYTAASSHRPTDPDGRNTEHDHGRANPTDTMAPSLECAWPGWVRARQSLLALARHRDNTSYMLNN